MRVAHIIFHLEVGGAELFLHDLVLALAESSLTQHVFCVGPGGPLAAPLADAGIPVTALGKRTKLGLATIVRLARALRAFGADVVQTHGEAGVFWGLPAARLAAAPAVSALIYQNYLETRAKMAASRLLLPRADLVVAGSNAVRGFALGHFGAHPGRVVTIHNGIRVAALRRERPRLKRATAPRLLTIGRLVARKGHEVAVRAMPRILALHPEAELRIVGDGPLRPRLEALVRELGVERHVTLPGTIWPSTPVLAGADLFLFPSLDEPQGLAVLEAFAAGVPVVASRTGGIVEMVEHDVTGVLVEPGNVEALAAAVIGLLSDEGRRERLARRAARRAEEFDIARVAARFERCYQRLVEPSHRLAAWEALCP